MSDELQLPGGPLSATRPSTLALTLRLNAAQLLVPLSVMWVVQCLSVLPFVHFWQYGIRPRTVAGLTGILLAPFIHGGFPHLMANTVPFVLLGGLVLLGGARLFRAVTAFVVLAGGLGVWLIGWRGSVHIGASGLIFGYLGFLMTRGFLERSLPWMLLAVVLIVAYGGLLAGVLPFQPGISWQSHLCGFLAGIGAARMLVSRKRAAIAA